MPIPFPVNFEQEGHDGVSVSLGDLVRHMHPYCMTVSVENEEGEHILPEGGILLEVVDQGENGEPILAIPDMDLPVSLPCKEQPEDEEKVPDDVGAHSSEHILVDDDVIRSNALAKVAAPLEIVGLDTKGEKIIITQKEEIKERSPSRRKKKKKVKTKCQTKPMDGEGQKVQPKKPEQKLEDGTKDKVTKLPPDSALPLPVEPQKPNPSPSVPRTEIATTTLEPETNEQIQTSASPRLQEMAPSAPPDTMAPSQQSSGGLGHPGPVCEEMEGSSSSPVVSSDVPASPSQPISPDMSHGPPPGTAALTEPKPKSLSLAEYRRLRQQKKPTPVEKTDGDNSSKWPSLPVLPKGLPPIPCLPNPSTRDPRRTNPQTGKREMEEVKPAWQPRGPCAPPTPEALLVPPAYMVSSTSKVPAARPQPTPEPSKSPSLQASPHVAPTPHKNVTIQQNTTTVPSGPQGSSLNPLRSEKQYKSPSPSGEESHPSLSEGKGGSNQRPPQLKTCPRTTTVRVESTAAPTSASVTSEKSSAFSPNGREVGVCTVTGGAVSSKVNDTEAASGAHASHSLALKVDPAVPENKGRPCTGGGQRPKTPTQELIEAFTSEIGEFRLSSTF